MRSVLSRFLLAFCVVLAVPGLAQAFIWRVAYSDAGRPSVLPKTFVIRAIQQVLREWDQHSRGRVITQYIGEPDPVPSFPPSDMLIISWAALGIGDESITCGRTCRHSELGTCLSGTHRGYIELNSSLVTFNGGLNPRWTPDGTPWRCEDMQSVLMHEFAHNFEDQGNHLPDSVLSYSTTDVASRHLWQYDMGGAIPFPAHAFAVRFQTISPTTRGIIGTVDVSPVYNPHTPISIATAGGDGGRNFAMAWSGTDSGTLGNPEALIVARGDASTWDVRPYHAVTLSGTTLGERRTPRRPCVVVSNRGLDYYVVWASSTQVPDANVPSNPINTFSGSRQVFAMESHDAGETFSNPEAITGAFTRQGISCSLDQLQGRVVVAYAGSGEEQIWITHRPSQSTGAGLWSAPAPIAALPFQVTPTTRDMPVIAFDFFDGAVGGRLMWFENTTMTHRVASVGLSGSTYQLFSTPVDRVEPTGWTSPYNTYEFLRSDPIINFEGEVVFFGATSIFNTMRAFRQWDLPTGVTTSNSINEWTFGGGVPIAWATGAASNRSLLAYGTANMMLLNPN